MHMPEPSLIIWIIGAPLIVAIVDLVRTVSALRNSSSEAPGAYSRALNIDQTRLAQTVA